MKLSKLTMAAVIILTASSCRHKDLYMDEGLSSDIMVIFDWRDAPQADPAAMAMYMYTQDGNSPLRYIFSNKTGGKIKVPFGLRHALSFNADNNDWAHTRHAEDIERMEIFTSDADALAAQNLLSTAVPRARDASGERMAVTPGMLWATRTNNINISPHSGTDTITVYPHEAVCYYTVDIYDVENLDGVMSSRIDATLSGMAEAYTPGPDSGSDTPVTMSFILKSNADSRNLHGDFLTFGDCPTAGAKHYLTVYMVLNDGSKWYRSFDVTGQVTEASDPRHVHIVVRGLPLPEPPSSSGTVMMPDVNDWQTINIDLKM